MSGSTATATGAGRRTLRAMLGTTLAGDPVAQAALGLLALSAALYLLPLLSEAALERMTWTYSYFVFLALVVVALLKDLDRVPSRDERRLWRGLAAGFGLWTLVPALHFWRPDYEYSVVQGVTEDVLYALAYLVLVVTVENHARRAVEPRLAGLERALAWPGLSLLVLGLLLYFVGVPIVANWSAYESTLPSLYVFVGLDLYLAATLARLARMAPTLRWRLLNTLLAAAVVFILASDTLELVHHWVSWLEWPQHWDWLWWLPYVAVAIAVRARHAPVADASAQAAAAPPALGHGLAGRTMAAALLFPLMHFGCYFLGLLDEASRPARARLILWWLPLLVLIALLQHRVLESRARVLWRQRARSAEALRHSEKDLRLMVDRSYAERELRRREQKFAKAFRVNPDAMAITTIEQGLLLEVNESFERTFGYRRDELVGRTTLELGLWADPGDRARLLRELDATGRVRDLETVFRRRTGEREPGLLSAERLSFDGRPCLISALRPLRELPPAGPANG